jgi:hypothetical protein
MRPDSERGPILTQRQTIAELVALPSIRGLEVPDRADLERREDVDGSRVRATMIIAGLQDVAGIDTKMQRYGQ